MTRFQAEWIDRRGERVRADLEAPDRDALLEALERAALERLPSAPGSPHELEALAALAEATSRAASARVDLIARATLPLALLLLGALTGVTYVAPHVLYQSLLGGYVAW